jgi:hypothetical protein
VAANRVHLDMKERLTASLGDLAQLWGTSERMIENGAPLASDDAAAIVSAINRIDSEEMADVAANLRVARLTALDLRERDQLLVEASALHCWGSLSNRARRLSVEMRRYAASAWLHDRARLHVPSFTAANCASTCGTSCKFAPSPKRKARQKNIGHEINPWPAG